VSDEELATFTDAEKARLARINAFMTDGNAYFQISATRPQTVAYGHADSPVAQLAWIIEKFKEWTHPAEALPDTAVDRNRLLTNVMLYWLTGTAGSSAQLYYENMHSGSWRQERVTVPTGVAVFAEDMAIRRYAEQGHNIVHWSEFDRGGHFAALEAPDLYVGDVRTFFRTLR
jgi:pimeloyl-ACP methyl ester carboxylesterase